MNELWEILVPCQWSDGKPVRTRYHKEWDRRVRDITGGLTVLKPGTGQWVNEGEVYIERMIPVRIMATREQMLQICRITTRHYEQLAVMFYKVSEHCEIVSVLEEDKAKFKRG